MTRVAIAAVLALAALAGCAPASSGGQAGAQQPATVSPKRITAAIQSDGTTLWEGTGGRSLIELFSAGLVAFDLPGEPFPQLAEAVPTLENGLWKLFPDGRMETTIKIRDGARWHDGAPVTAADAVFGAAVGKEFPLSSNFGATAFANIEQIQALDDRSIVVTWKSPYVQANWLFSYLFAPPLPSHLLEESFSASKDTFMNQRFWTTEFVGNGPFVVHDFMAGNQRDAQGLRRLHPGAPQAGRNRGPLHPQRQHAHGQPANRRHRPDARHWIVAGAGAQGSGELAGRDRDPFSRTTSPRRSPIRSLSTPIHRYWRTCSSGARLRTLRTARPSCNRFRPGWET